MSFVRYFSTEGRRRLVRGLSNQFNRPKRIILLRHGESTGNVDDREYVTTADWKIPLSQIGHTQANEAGRKLFDIIGDEDAFFYVSPYLRTRQTLKHILESFPKSQILGVREEPRIVEQQFGNFQNQEEVKNAKISRKEFGRFFYRFPFGESGLDVYNRATSFLSTLFRDAQQLRAVRGSLDHTNIVIVTHGLTLRLFLMRWFQYTVHEFEDSQNPRNCEIVVMSRSQSETGVQHYELSEETCKRMNLPTWGNSFHSKMRGKFESNYPLS